MKSSVFWHRRDLRINDNAGLFKALKSSEEVQPIFIFDRNILDLLPKNDQRVLFIYKYVNELKAGYRKLGSDLWVFYGNPLEILPKLVEEKNFHTVYANRDYEPYALSRDQKIYELLSHRQIEFHGAKDHVIFEKNEVMKDNDKPYTVFTPYSKKWKSKLTDYYLSAYPVEKYISKLTKREHEKKLPTLQEMGFIEQQLFPFPKDFVSDELIKNYDQQRNFPSIDGTSRLSVHLRFGTISNRALARKALKLNETFLNELIWRDFYQMIMYHFPYSVKNSFKSSYDRIQWEKNEEHFQAWCHGKTGYPLVDAGMRELNQTGFMHNRVRMVVASFLTKHLLIDWRWGESYFAERLMDFELASNVGGWQWAAGCGCDAAPYFRVFNPASQQDKFDKNLEYIRKWVPEFGTSTYPAPIIDHKFARERVLERFKLALKETFE
jgi:deoxyribodipyrimidine photo-lyase